MSFYSKKRSTASGVAWEKSQLLLIIQSVASNTRQHFTVFIVSLLLCVGLVLQTAYAVPTTVSYQGVLKDKKGKPLNGTQVLTFSIYSVAQGGSSLWTETQNISATAGNVTVLLGAVNPLKSELLTEGRYLGIRVNTDSEMIPRIVLNSSVFAIRAGIAESVANGSVGNDKLSPNSVNSEKIVDGTIVTTKLAANSVTTDKIANGAVTTEKLSAEVQQKLAQTGTASVSLPASVATLNVTDKLKVGKNSIYLGPTMTGGTDNSIYTDTSDLLVQSDTTKIFNTVINANNMGKVGIGTSAPKAKLDVNGAVKISSTEGFDAYKFGKGLFAAYDSISNEGEMSSLDLTASDPKNWVYSNLTLNGGYLFLNQKQPFPNLTPEGKDKSKGNVAIGTMAGLLPKNQLDVAGSVAIGSGYAGTKTAPANGLIVEGEIQGKLWNSQEFIWSQSFPAVKMSPVSNGFCFLTSVQGKFVGYGDVNVFIQGDFWYLGGNSGQAHVVGKARCAGKPFTPDSPSDSWIKRIQSGRTFKLILDTAPASIGSIKGGNTYSCTYNGSFTCSGYNLQARRDGSWTYAGVDPANKEISLWGAKFMFDDAGEIYHPQYGHVGYLSQ